MIEYVSAIMYSVCCIYDVLYMSDYVLNCTYDVSVSGHALCISCGVRFRMNGVRCVTYVYVFLCYDVWCIVYARFRMMVIKDV